MMKNKFQGAYSPCSLQTCVVPDYWQVPHVCYKRAIQRNLLASDDDRETGTDTACAV